MQDQPKYIAYRGSTFFKDGLSSRPLVEGTVPRGWLRADQEFYTGKTTKAQAALSASSGQNQPGMTNQDGRNGTGTLDQIGQSSSSAQISTGARNASAQTAGGANGAQGGANDLADVNAFPFPVTKPVLERGKERYEIFCAICHGMTGEGDGMVVRRGFRKPPSYHTDELRRAPVGHYFDVITNGWGAMPNYAPQIPAQDRWAIIAYIRALQLSYQGLQTTNATGPGLNTGGTGQSLPMPQPTSGGHK
ncbi:MAG: cytochrome c [Pyrinomonadaceae bacterium]